MAADTAEALARVPLLSGLSRRDLRRLASSMRERSFPPGAKVLTEGENGVGFFVIADGTATVSVGDAVVRTLQPGDHFGEVALIDRQARTATVTADGELRCLGMTAWEFKPFVSEHPDVAWALLKTLVARLREAESR
jgi:CRP-like cAMP-binding protein